ncbi:Uncharacterised protein [Mycobacteroides abscessus subsp. abscessus]|nr:Uncharacterised protein [Mycobacteroides abscessus subsp. abscessus]
MTASATSSLTSVSTGGSATKRRLRTPVSWSSMCSVHFAATLALVFLRAFLAAFLKSSIRSSALARPRIDSSGSALQDSMNGRPARSSIASR